MRIVAEPSKGDFFSETESMNQNCKLSIDDVVSEVIPYKSSDDSALVFVSSTIFGEQTISVNCNGQPVGIVSVGIFDHVLNYSDQLDQLVLDNNMNVLFTAMKANNQRKLPTLDLQFSVPLNELQDDVELTEDIINEDASDSSESESSETMESEAKVTSKAIARRLLDSIDSMDFGQLFNHIAKTMNKAEKISKYLDQQYKETDIVDIDIFDIDSLLSLFKPNTVGATLTEEIVVVPTVSVPLKGESASSDFLAYAIPLDVDGNKISFVGDDDIKQVHVPIESDYLLYFENKKDEVIRFTLNSDILDLNQEYIKDVEDDLHGMIPFSDDKIDEMIEEAFDAEYVDKPGVTAIDSAKSEQLNGSASIFGTLLPILLLLVVVSVIVAFIFIKRALCNLLKTRRSESEEQEASARTYYQMEEDNTYPQISATEIAL